MSIYDDQFNEDPKSRPQQPEPAQLASAPPEPVTDALPADASAEEAEAPRRRGCGCGSCLLALLVTGLLCIAFCGVGGYLGFQRAPGWAHDTVIAAVNESDLDADTKQQVTAQMDRLLKAYKEGNVSTEQMGSAFKELAESPVMVLLMSYATVEGYVEPSGLSEDEKAAAKLVFQRVARGVYVQDIDPDDLEDAFDYISKKDFNGNRQLKSRVSDEELRALIEECTRVADDADVPDEPYQVDIAAEVKRIVDRALGIMPEEEVEPLDIAPADEPAGRFDPVDESSAADSVSFSQREATAA